MDDPEAGLEPLAFPVGANPRERPALLKSLERLGDLQERSFDGGAIRREVRSIDDILPCLRGAAYWLAQEGGLQQLPESTKRRVDMNGLDGECRAIGPHLNDEQLILAWGAR